VSASATTVSPGLPWTAAAPNAAEPARPPRNPRTPAARTISGNGVPKAKIATNDATARPTITRFFSAARPIRNTACSTTASTAAFSPKNSPSTTGTSPSRT
jgi:hypothetical protein